MSLRDNIRNRRKALDMTLEEVAQKIGTSRQTVQRYESGVIGNIPSDKIEKLAETFGCSPADLMGWSDNEIKSITPVTGVVPIIGCIPAGVPVLAQQNVEGYMPVIVKNPNEYFCFRVKGSSMLNANIHDGSMVLIHQQNTAENGEIVACRVNGDEATLKRFKCVGETVLLLPENPEYQPIIVSCKDFESGYAEIIGVAKQVIMDL